MASKNKIELIFVINGQEYPVDANLKAPLKAARDKALEESDNTGRPFDEWQVRTEAGVILDPNAKVEDLGLADGTRLYLNLEIGAGG